MIFNKFINPESIDKATFSTLRHKRVLITGGSGTLGHALTSLLLSLHLGPDAIIIFSRDEAKQTMMAKLFSSVKLRFFIGDVRDFERLKLATQNVSIIIHAAALKQVPSCEYNPIECVKTNIYGAQNIILASVNMNVHSVLALSTDKAANPINIYGASKLCADKLFSAANSYGTTKFSCVRYGNVLGSRGSVIPHYRSILQENGRGAPLPITDIHMTRFFLTPEEGVTFIMKCLTIMNGGEIFVPKLPRIEILSLISAMNETGKYTIIGKRPGEKLHELLLSSDDSNYVRDYNNFYVLNAFNSDNVIYKLNGTEYRGINVPENFQYSSQAFGQYLSELQIREMINDS